MHLYLNKAELYNTCIIPIFVFGSECWAVTEVDTHRIDTLDQWCLRTLLGIKMALICLQWGGEEDIQAAEPYSNDPVTASFHVWAHCTYRWWCRCQGDPNGFPSRELEDTNRMLLYAVSCGWTLSIEIWQPHSEKSSKPGSESLSVEAAVYVWRYALLVVHARKEV